jgi:hypothetical protein
MSDFTARNWSNGENCPDHNNPYCSTCFRALLSKAKDGMMDSKQRMERIRDIVTRRIQEGNFHRPARRNFFEDSRRRQFALSCQVGEEGHVVMPLTLALLSDDPEAHCWQATDEEILAILKIEHVWDTSTPSWAQNFVPDDYSMEDQILLRELQLFN